ncbi:MAG: type IV secretory system conjugative DNA transfer family protein [Acidimicrobiales bacterium]
MRLTSEYFGGGAFLGWYTQNPLNARWWMSAPVQSAVCVLAPPQGGKTTGVVMPSVASAPGAVVVTSIKRDVLDATSSIRRRSGRCWLFDPSGREVAPEGVELVRWSPVVSAKSWDDSRIVARSMVAAAMSLTSGLVGVGGTGGEAHFMDKATDALAPMLYAAFHAARTMVEVSDWLYRSDPSDALGLLHEQAEGGGTYADSARIAWSVLNSVEQLAERERSSVYSTAQRVVTAYLMEGVRGLVTDPNFDPNTFVNSTDTLYIVAGLDVQAAAAPVVVALLTAITTAVYERERAVSAGVVARGMPVQMILDEAANIAPIADLPQWLSTAGGNGLHLVVVFQDLSQVAGRWGRHIAAGILTLCSTKMVLGGIADPDTLNALSGFIGQYDRVMTSYSNGPGGNTVSTSIQRQAVLEPGQIAQMARGQALLITGSQHQMITLGPWWDTNSPWQQIHENHYQALGGQAGLVALDETKLTQ